MEHLKALLYYGISNPATIKKIDEIWDQFTLHRVVYLSNSLEHTSIFDLELYYQKLFNYISLKYIISRDNLLNNEFNDYKEAIMKGTPLENRDEFNKVMDKFMNEVFCVKFIDYDNDSLIPKEELKESDVYVNEMLKYEIIEDSNYVYINTKYGSEVLFDCSKKIISFDKLREFKYIHVTDVELLSLEQIEELFKNIIQVENLMINIGDDCDRECESEHLSELKIDTLIRLLCDLIKRTTSLRSLKFAMTEFAGDSLVELFADTIRKNNTLKFVVLGGVPPCHKYKRGISIESEFNSKYCSHSELFSKLIEDKPIDFTLYVYYNGMSWDKPNCHTATIKLLDSVSHEVT